MEPLLFYILHRANAVIADRQITSVFKAFFIDEAWVFLKNPSIQRYVIEALKTWRKHNAAMILSTQSLDELKRSDILDVIIESCATKIFLANPDMDRDLYRRQFHLNENEVELISGLIPKQQFLIKTPELAKVANLNVDPKSYWLYTNDPLRQQEAERSIRDLRLRKRPRSARGRASHDSRFHSSLRRLGCRALKDASAVWVLSARARRAHDRLPFPGRIGLRALSPVVARIHTSKQSISKGASR